MNNNLLEIKNLHAAVDGKEILKGVDLTIRRGEVHAVMGPNGAGKSTLGAVLAGRPTFEVTAGSVLYDGRDLIALSPEERSWAGLFLSFQYPVEIPGVSITNFMKAAVNARRKAQGLPELTPGEYLKLLKEKMAFVQMKGEFARREVNVGFSGGEKKRNEIFQMAMLEPTLSILDETDSGLDVDALRIVAEGVNRLRTPQTAAIVITHYQRLLEYIVPDVVHVLKDGRIVRTGGRELVDLIEEKGYGPYLTPRIGHGLGMEEHEEPYIFGGNSVILEKGMCFSDEPGIYLPDWGGVRIEDDITVTDDAGRSITDFPRELRIL